jgi:hypothetical protein
MTSADLILAPFDGPGQGLALSVYSLVLLPANTHPATALNEPFGLKVASDPFKRPDFCLRFDSLTGQRTI